MDGSMAQTEHWESYLALSEFAEAEQGLFDQTDLTSPLPQPDVEVAESGKKRKGRKPTQTESEKRRKKIESDKNYRRGLRDKLDGLQKMESEYGGLEEIVSELDKLEQMKSKYGGLEEIDSQLNQLEQIKSKYGEFEEIDSELDKLEQMKSKYGGLEEIDSKLDKLEQMKSKYGGFEEIDSKFNKLYQMEAESTVFEKVKNMFGGIDNIVPGLDRLKRTEFKHAVFKPNQTDKSLIEFIPSSADSLQDQDSHGEHSMNSNNQGSTGDRDLLVDYGISQMSLRVETPTEYSDVLVTDFIAMLEKNTRSNLNFSSFKDLDGKPQRVGNYSFPMSLVSTVKAIREAHGDVTKNCLLSPIYVQNPYVFLSAAIKEMGDLSLEQVTEDIMLKWRDAIKDARRIDCDVEFAWKHLETIAYAYFGLKARNYGASLKQRVEYLMAKEKALRQKLEKNVEEVKSVKAEEDGLTSSQCKMCQECADRFLDKNVGLFG